jgi:hypothetical protein
MHVYDHLVTMTENDPHICADDCWHNPMSDPMAAWLQANNIDFERIPLFPEIELLGPEMMIEYFWGMEDQDKPWRQPPLMRRRMATRMVRRPILVPIDNDLWEAYQRLRTAHLADEALKTLGQAGATVLSAKGGSHLVFVCSSSMPQDGDFIEQASRILQESLPGVGVQIMTGVDTILHRVPQDDR